jgi:predicted dehydrogenase
MTATSQPPLRVAMVGSGRRAGEQLEAMGRSARAVPVGFWNRTRQLADQRSREAGLQRGFATVTEMIERTSPDVVNIVTHPSARIPLLREAIDAGARVILLEKPIALTREELAVVRALGDEAFIAVNTQYWWMSHWRHFWQVIAEGGIGDIRSIRVSARADVLEQGPHLMSLALGAARAAGLALPSWVLAASAGESSHGDVVVPADVAAVMDLGEARLQLLAGPSAPWLPDEDNLYYQQQVEITGTKGRIWSSLTQGWNLWTEHGWSSGTTGWPRDDHQSQSALFAELARAVRDPSRRDGFPTSVHRAAEEAEILFAAIESARGAGRVELPW